MKVLQAHSRHAARGGADDVMDRDRDLLLGAGHEVQQYVAGPADGSAQQAWRQAADVVWNVETKREVRDVLRSFRPDVLHVHTPFPMLSPAVFHAARAAGVPTVTTLHSYRYSCIAGTLRREGRICEDCVGTRLKLGGLRHSCYHGRAASAAMTTSLVVHHRFGTFSRHVDRYLALTDFARGVLIRDGIAPDRVTVKPNSVDDPGEPQPHRDRARTLLFVGRLVPEKGVTTLLDAWRRLDRSDWHLVMVGDGPLRPEVERAAAEQPTMTYLGWQDQRSVAGLQASSRATIVCSEWYEGQPLVLLDALAHGTPVVVSDLENLSASVLGHEAGVGFSTGDAASLSQALALVMDRPEAAAAMAAAARDLYLRAHTPGANLAALEQVYGEVIEERGPR